MSFKYSIYILFLLTLTGNSFSAELSYTRIGSSVTIDIIHPDGTRGAGSGTRISLGNRSVKDLITHCENALKLTDRTKDNKQFLKTRLALLYLTRDHCPKLQNAFAFSFRKATLRQALSEFEKVLGEKIPTTINSEKKLVIDKFFGFNIEGREVLRYYAILTGTAITYDGKSLVFTPKQKDEEHNQPADGATDTKVKNDE